MPRRCWGPLVALLSLSCQPDAPATATPVESGAPTEAAREDPNAAFRAAADAWVSEALSRNPARAVELGLHEHDGKLRDLSDAGLAAETAALTRALATFRAFDPSALDPIARVELGILEQSIRGELFELQRRRQPSSNPMFYLADLNLQPYISRDYAPKEQRAAAIVAVADATATHLSYAQGRLDAAIPRTFIDTALLQTAGTIAFVQDDVPKAMAGLDEATQATVDAALSRMLVALQGYEAFLKQRAAAATDDYALGPELFLEMLRESQGFDVSLERLEAIGREDLERNLTALAQAAKQLDAKRSIAKVVERVNADKPKATAVLAEATAQADAMRKFVVDHQLITIPSPDLAEVRESPPFMRWNAAFLDGAGAFETAPLPSFYYISPPDPSWPRKQQKAYIPGKTDLLFITIHELWPGHFLHGLHLKANPSRVMKSSWNYAMGEGWAHYTEEMMWAEGISDDPAVHIGQLLNALLRDVRYLSAIGLHTGGMTVEQSLAMFRDQAFADEANARQQAVRGTFDPMYLSYTLGKLAILKLRADTEAKWTAEGKAFTLQAFHDALLSYGAAPLPVIRTAILGPDAGPIL